MFKKMILKDGNQLIISAGKNVISINKRYLDANEVIKTLSLAVWDKIIIYGYFNHADHEFMLDDHDPLYWFYLPLFKAEKTFTLTDGTDTLTFTLINKQIKIRVDQLQPHDSFRLVIKPYTDSYNAFLRLFADSLLLLSQDQLPDEVKHLALIKA